MPSFLTAEDNHIKRLTWRTVSGPSRGGGFDGEGLCLSSRHEWRGWAGDHFERPLGACCRHCPPSPGPGQHTLTSLPLFRDCHRFCLKPYKCVLVTGMLNSGSLDINDDVSIVHDHVCAASSGDSSPASWQARSPRQAKPWQEMMKILLVSINHQELALSVGSTTRIHEFANSQIRKFANSQIHKFTNSQIHKFTNPQIHKSTNPQIHKSTNPQIHKSTNPQIPPFSSP